MNNTSVYSNNWFIDILNALAITIEDIKETIELQTKLPKKNYRFILGLYFWDQIMNNLAIIHKINLFKQKLHIWI